MTPIVFAIKRIDHDGYNGRDHHPSDRHIGMHAVPFAMTTDYYDEDGGWEAVNEKTDATLFSLETVDKCFVTGWDCRVIETGEIVTLMDHEIEVVR